MPNVAQLMDHYIIQQMIRQKQYPVIKVEIPRIRAAPPARTQILHRYAPNRKTKKKVIQFHALSHQPARPRFAPVIGQNLGRRDFFGCRTEAFESAPDPGRLGLDKALDCGAGDAARYCDGNAAHAHANRQIPRPTPNAYLVRYVQPGDLPAFFNWGFVRQTDSI